MIGQRLSNRYDIRAELGRGGMGVVYRAHDPLLNREVAIKLIPPTLLSAETEQRFQREAQLVAQMDHPAVVPIFDFGKHEGSLFFVMPIVQGTTLRSFQREAALTLGEVLDIGIQVCRSTWNTVTRAALFTVISNPRTSWWCVKMAPGSEFESWTLVSLAALPKVVSPRPELLPARSPI